MVMIFSFIGQKNEKLVFSDKNGVYRCIFFFLKGMRDTGVFCFFVLEFAGKVI